MPPEPLDPALNIFAVGTLLLSIIACMNVIHMRRAGEVLPYEPRRPVPWGWIGGILAMTYVLIPASTAFSGSGDNDGGSLQSLAPTTLIFSMIGQLFIVSGFLFVIAIFTKSTLRDLGLPANLRQTIRDACIGGAACLAALAPVHMLQVMLMHLLSSDDEIKSGHPLIKMVIDAPPNPWILVLAGVAAVVVAPICEEIAFRLLLQGWLERWEDSRLGWRKKAVDESPSEVMLTLTHEAFPNGAQPTQPCIPALAATDLAIESDPPPQGLLGLPYGWFSIIISAAAFGLAHFGYGPEPVPLFVLALVLGFIYQRTHRILPGIVAHALFNLFTMIILWRMVYHHG